MAKKRVLKQFIRLVRPPDATGVGVLCLSNRTLQAFYAFKEIPCAIGGRGFAVHRLGLSELYHLRVGKPEECSCECLGFLQHRKCKHVLGLLALTGHELI